MYRDISITKAQSTGVSNVCRFCGQAKPSGVANVPDLAQEDGITFLQRNGYISNGRCTDMVFIALKGLIFLCLLYKVYDVDA